uniref:RNA-polymerase II-associated protein 3-like C-terminal domain-containing protein n=2 Tax=Arion vulgaris TaxID=1028688 RepID=A0A0B7BAE1_9EUPU
MCHKYKLSLQDLIELLKLEPKNTAAQKEMDAVKQLYKEELEKLKKKATAEQESKVRKRMKIEEVDDEDEDEKPRSKISEKLKGQNKSRSGKQPQQSPGSRSKTNNADKKQSRAQKTPVQGQPVAPPVAPRLMKTTPYEFCQAWNSLKSCQGIQPYADILRQISPADLPSVISNKLDGQMLQVIMRCVYEEMVLKGDVDLGYQFLDRLCQVPRFSTVSMFMTSKEKKEVSSVLDILSKTISTAYTSADIVRLKKEYSVK